jgi:hypothetical protein
LTGKITVRPKTTVGTAQLPNSPAIPSHLSAIPSHFAPQKIPATTPTQQKYSGRENYTRKKQEFLAIEQQKTRPRKPRKNTAAEKNTLGIYSYTAIIFPPSSLEK